MWLFAIWCSRKWSELFDCTYFFPAEVAGLIESQLTQCGVCRGEVPGLNVVEPGQWCVVLQEPWQVSLSPVTQQATSFPGLQVPPEHKVRETLEQSKILSHRVTQLLTMSQTIKTKCLAKLFKAFVLWPLQSVCRPLEAKIPYRVKGNNINKQKTPNSIKGPNIKKKQKKNISSIFNAMHSFARHLVLTLPYCQPPIVFFFVYSVWSR